MVTETEALLSKKTFMEKRKAELNVPPLKHSQVNLRQRRMQQVQRKANERYGKGVKSTKQLYSINIEKINERLKEIELAGGSGDPDFSIFSSETTDLLNISVIEPKLSKISPRVRGKNTMGWLFK